MKAEQPDIKSVEGERIAELETAVSVLEGVVEKRTKERDDLLRVAKTAAVYLTELKQELNLDVRGYKVLDDELTPTIDKVAGVAR